ncbi:MAG: HIT family protein [Candidatus Daviesbacteria bacterium]|nr:HIT family protein [Candidatus Daviesbacteria bacterium]
MDNCVFCKIIKGEIPHNKIWEDDDFIASLSIDPIKPGHTLVIPKKHTDYIFDMEDVELGKLIVACKPIAKALKVVFKPQTGKIGVMVAGMGVFHVHIHLIPMDSEHDLNFDLAKRASSEELQENVEKIKSAFK